MLGVVWGGFGVWYATSISVGCGVQWVWCVVCHFCKCWVWGGCGVWYVTSVSVGCVVCGMSLL